MNPPSPQKLKFVIHELNYSFDKFMEQRFGSTLYGFTCVRSPCLHTNYFSANECRMRIINLADRLLQIIYLCFTHN